MSDPSVTEQVAEVIETAAWADQCPHDSDPYSACFRCAAEALAAAGLTPQGRTVEEWGVRSHGTVYHGDRWTREHALCHNEIHETGASLVHRAIVTYPDRVSEWEPAPEEER